MNDCPDQSSLGTLMNLEGYGLQVRFPLSVILALRAL